MLSPEADDFLNEQRIPRSLLAAAGFTPRRIESPTAWVGHIPFAAWLMREVSPKVFVELGTHSGNSYFSVCQIVTEAVLGTRCYAVDTWVGDKHSGLYGEEIFQDVEGYNQEHYQGFSTLLRMTFDEGAARFAEKSVDVLHIDGQHTYEDVRHDFETWLPKLAPGAIVMLHDTNVRERDFGVWRFWEELQSRFPYHMEFTHSHGLGVIQVDHRTGSAEMYGFSADPTEKKTLGDYFAALGARQLERYQLGISRRETQVLARDIEARVKDYDSITEAYEAQKARSAQEIGELRNQLHGMRVSTSWRVTHPLRVAGFSLKGIRKIYWAMRGAMRRERGLRGAARKAIRLYRRSGLIGLKAAIRTLAQAETTSRISGLIAHDRNDYAEWIRRYDTRTDEGRSTMRAYANDFAHKPLLSIVMPVYNPKSEWLVEAIESVRDQLYPHWELCIADDASTDPRIRTILDGYVKRDGRIKVMFRERNGHICAASNSALRLAAGEWVVLLDHDDVLSEVALFWTVDAINRHPEARLIYSDEDKIDERGERHDPYFKCEWNIDLFYSQNMFSHLGAFRRDVLLGGGGFREGFEGSQDHDLVLRCIEVVDGGHIHHIPRVLYHWRAHAASTAYDSGTNPYAKIAGERALNEYLARQRIQATATSEVNGYRLHYRLPDPAPKVSIIIPTRDNERLLKRCIESVTERTRYRDYELIIVDNGSVDATTVAYLRDISQREGVRVIRDDRPFNYSALNNRAAKEATGEILCLLNDDIEVITLEWLSELVSVAIQPGVGAVGAKLLYPDDTIQHGGVILGLGGVAGHFHKGLSRDDYGYFGRASLVQGVSAVTGACLMVRKGVYEAVGGLNETELTVAFNDVDFCLRVREVGYRNIWTPYAELYHHESVTRGPDASPIKRARFEREVRYMRDRWKGILGNDPAYSPNLTLDYEDVSYAWPPRVPAYDCIAERGVECEGSTSNAANEGAVGARM